MADQTFHYSSETGGAELLCENVWLSELAREYGTPLYVYSKKQILDNFAAFGNALSKAEGNGHYISYAVKANSNPEILRQLSAAGAGADVVSGGEMLAALKNGFTPEHITFDGPGKTDAEIVLALEKNIFAFNVESLEEIKVISSFASQLGKTAKIFIRVNPDVDAKSHPYISTGLKQNKFGVSLTEAHEVFRQAAQQPNIQLIGLHVHIGSQITELSPFLEAAESTVKFIAEMKAEGITLEYLNFGGGQGIQYYNVIGHPLLVSDTQDEEKKNIPSLAEFINSALPILAKSGLKLIFEPGRAIVANAGVLLTRVLYRKENSAKTFIIADAGMSDLIRPSLYGAHHQIAPLVLKNAEHEVADLVGPICESGDFLAQHRSMNKFMRGDELALLTAGAYGFVLASNYNTRPKPAEVMVDGDKHFLVRARQKVEDIIL